MVVVGAGIIGRSAAWHLAEQGHSVTMVDPALADHPNVDALSRAQPNTPPPALERLTSGSQAALGMLMARVFHRSSGRAWRLRQQSQALWEDWLAELERRGHRLPRRRGLLLLAATTEELAQQERLVADRARWGMGLRRLDRCALEELQPALPGRPLGGLHSPEDGQLDPGPVLEALLQEARRAAVACVAATVVALERGPGEARRWRLRLAGGGALEAEWLVLALGLGTGALLAGLGHALPLEPVVGQALELELELADAPHWTWPGSVVWRGVNLVPRPEATSGGRRLWLGATLEPGEQARGAALEALRRLDGEAPPWLRRARVVRHWQGVRCRPVGQAAPVLAEPEPGLLIATGHYRNGILLAPATAAWLGERIRGT